MKVTFDSNVWQQIVRPDLFPMDQRHAEISVIREAIKKKKLFGFISDTVAGLEAIKKVDRANYLSSQRLKTNFEETESSTDGSIAMKMTLGPDNSQHPGLTPVLRDRISDALKLGFKFLKFPRLGQPMPAELLQTNVYVSLSDVELGEKHDRQFAVEREIQARNVGFAVIKKISERIELRTPEKGLAWFEYLSMASDEAEQNEIKKAVAEWADGDSLASHIGYENDFFCTEDVGKSSGLSIFDANNRNWAEVNYGVRFVTIVELADEIRRQ
jgi:hypothetical protein